MTGPDPRVAAVRSAVRDAIADVPDDALVLVACSGGADSLALAAATGFVAPRRGVRAGAVVVDHGWDAGSAEVAARVATTCRSIGLDPVDVVAVDSTPSGQGPEAAARAARYRALHHAADRHQAVAVLLGHTLDDQAETVLLGLARGSGTRSLAGMAARRGLLRRPLLRLPRADVRASCDVLGLTPVEDPSNRDPAFARSRVRHTVLPALEAELGPGVAAALARTADLLRADAEVLDDLAEQALARLAVPTGPDGGGGRGGPVLDAVALAAEPDAVRRRVLRLAAVRAGASAGALGHRHVVAVDALLTRWTGQGPVHLPGRASAARACGRLSFAGPGPAGDGPSNSQRPQE